MSKKVYEYWIKKIKASSISERNKKTLMKLAEDMHDRDLSYARMRFYLAKLWVVIKTVNIDLDRLSEKDLRKLLRTFKKKKYSSWTLYGYKCVIKKFYQWLEFHNKDDYEWTFKKYPKKVEWIKITRKRNEQRLPEEILTKEEILRMAENCQNIRNKAIIICLYESGARINEFLDIRVKDLVFDDFGLTVIVSGKTGSRKLRLVTSTPYISMLLKEQKKDREDYLFTSRNGNRLSEWTVRQILQNIATKCNIVKPTNPHSFRHSRATHLAPYLTEAEMCIFFGWKLGSYMPRIYIHLSGKDLDDSMLKKVYGLVPEDKKEQETQNICLVCKERNMIEAQYCRSCGSILQITQQTLEDMIENVLKKRKV